MTTFPRVRSSLADRVKESCLLEYSHKETSLSFEQYATSQKEPDHVQAFPVVSTMSPSSTSTRQEKSKRSPMYSLSTKVFAMRSVPYMQAID